MEHIRVISHYRSSLGDRVSQHRPGITTVRREASAAVVKLLRMSKQRCHLNNNDRVFTIISPSGRSILPSVWQLGWMCQAVCLDMFPASHGQNVQLGLSKMPTNAMPAWLKGKPSKFYFFNTRRPSGLTVSSLLIPLFHGGHISVTCHACCGAMNPFCTNGVVMACRHLAPAKPRSR